jgi:hypothetical protein
VPQSARLRQEYLRLVDRLLERERADLDLSLGSAPDALEWHLRKIDDARRATGELEAALIQIDEPELLAGTEVLRNADHLLQPTMDAVALVIDGAVRHAGLQITQETYTCVLPTGMFNAQARLADGGVLVMINTGLSLLTYQVVQAMTADSSFDDPRMGRRLYTPGQLAESFTDIMLAQLLWGDSARAPHFPPQGGVRGQLSDSLWRSVQIFAAAHEFGHVLAGHLSPARTKFLPTPGWEEIECAAKTIRQEFEADLIGMRLVAAHAQASGHPQAPSIMVLGPLVFFAIVEAVDRIREEGLRRPVRGDIDHPPPRDRAAAARASLAQHVGSEDFELADAAVAWIDERTQGAIEYVTRTLDQARHMP